MDFSKFSLLMLLVAVPTHTTCNAVTQAYRVSSLVHEMFPVAEFHLATAAVAAEQ
jgi:hypothetical protein